MRGEVAYEPSELVCCRVRQPIVPPTRHSSTKLKAGCRTTWNTPWPSSKHHDRHDLLLRCFKQRIEVAIEVSWRSFVHISENGVLVTADAALQREEGALMASDEGRRNNRVAGALKSALQT